MIIISGNIFPYSNRLPNLASNFIRIQPEEQSIFLRIHHIIRIQIRFGYTFFRISGNYKIQWDIVRRVGIFTIGGKDRSGT